MQMVFSCFQLVEPKREREAYAAWLFEKSLRGISALQQPKNIMNSDFYNITGNSEYLKI